MYVISSHSISFALEGTWIHASVPDWFTNCTLFVHAPILKEKQYTLQVIFPQKGSAHVKLSAALVSISSGLSQKQTLRNQNFQCD